MTFKTYSEALDYVRKTYVGPLHAAEHFLMQAMRRKGLPINITLITPSVPLEESLLTDEDGDYITDEEGNRFLISI